MANPRKSLRRRLLRPLIKRRGKSHKKGLLQAVERLDARALTSDLVAKVQPLVPNLKGRLRQSWKDPEALREYISIIRALYENRRLSWSKFIFMAGGMIENACEGSLTDGDLRTELTPVEQAMGEVKSAHGLKPDEEFYLPTSPPEYRMLNKKWEAIVEQYLMGQFRAYGLNDIAELRESDPAAYDEARERGRRSVHHKEELQHAIRDVVMRYEEEARYAASAKAYTAAVTMLGAAIEGLLVLRCFRSKTKSHRTANELPRRLRPRYADPTTWTFEVLIDTSLKAGWLPQVSTNVAVYDSAGLAHLLRQMRNHVHPGRHARERPWTEVEERDYLDAESIFRVLLPILTGELRATKHAKSA